MEIFGLRYATGASGLMCSVGVKVCSDVRMFWNVLTVNVVRIQLTRTWGCHQVFLLFVETEPREEKKKGKTFLRKARRACPARTRGCWGFFGFSKSFRLCRLCAISAIRSMMDDQKRNNGQLINWKTCNKSNEPWKKQRLRVIISTA